MAPPGLGSSVKSVKFMATIWLLKKWDPKMDLNGDVNRENDDNPINLGVYYFEIF